MLPPTPLPPAVRAFDETARRFDERFGEWRSVAAQRRAVRRGLTQIFPPGSRLLELGGGTGDDACFLLERGYQLMVTDGAPRMVELAAAKLRAAGYGDVPVEQAVLEALGPFAERAHARSLAPFDGAFSNFAALNCVADIGALAVPLSRLVQPGGACAFVVFGRYSPGEVLVKLLRRRPADAMRRFRGGRIPARIGSEHFTVWYPSVGQIARALAPYFRLRRVRGIGILVPPSAAEPFISRFPRLVAALEMMDRVVTVPLARLGDHVLLDLERTAVRAPEVGTA